MGVEEYAYGVLRAPLVVAFAREFAFGAHRA